VDEMLGNIVRWLRILGFDTMAASSLREGAEGDIDTEIILVALRENRIIVTADTKLAERAKKLGLGIILVSPNGDTYTILKTILEILNLHEEARRNMLTRCPICNGILKPISREKAREIVPSRVYENCKDFWQCTACGKVYWIGSHFRNIDRVLHRLIGVSIWRDIS